MPLPAGLWWLLNPGLHHQAGVERQRVVLRESMFVTCGYEGVDDVGSGLVLEGFTSDDKA